MAFGPKSCACCGSRFGVEAHHLYSRRAGCPDDLSVWLCFTCDGRVHEMKRRMDITTWMPTALKQAKARSELLGLASPERGGNAQHVSELGATAIRAEADRYAANVLPIIRQLQASGFTTLRAITAELNVRGVRTARGGAWYSTTVRNLLLRENTGGSSA